jgi:hypothetical protein
MNKQIRISDLMIERYNLGEVTGGEKEIILAAFDTLPGLRDRLEELKYSDAEIRRRYPAPRLQPPAAKPQFRTFRFIGLSAAALVICVVLPALFFPNLRTSVSFTDRIKGNAGNVLDEKNRTGLKVYLKPEPGDAGEGNIELEDGAVLHEGNTIQLAYTVGKGRSGECYGVIFSIDGRSALTVHYPYGEGQSARLAPGKRILLDEAYTLDDAPDREIFFFVISDSPMDVKKILYSAKELAQNPKMAPERSLSVFKGYEIETVTLRKEQK